MLLDVGVWLAAVWGRHRAHPATRAWFDAQQGELDFCRVSQMSLLRLVTNTTIMGDDVLTRAAAWSVYDRLCADARVVTLDEPDALEPVRRSLTAREDASPRLWTDDYLAAFAQAGNLGLVTLDHAFAQRHDGRDVTLIG